MNDLCSQGQHYYVNVNKGTDKPPLWQCHRPDCGALKGA